MQRSNRSRSTAQISEPPKPILSAPGADEEAASPPQSLVRRTENNNYSHDTKTPGTRFNNTTPPVLQQMLQETSPESTESEFEPPNLLDTFFSTYRFLRADFMFRLPQEDIQHRGAQSCLFIPRKLILDEFVQKYFFHVHPLLPLINDSTFWETYNAQQDSIHVSSHSTLSLLILQAVLFAACRFVAPNILRMVGFRSTQHAQERFYHHCQVRFLSEQLNPLPY
jgi:hypothetical protein